MFLKYDNEEIVKWPYSYQELVSDNPEVDIPPNVSDEVLGALNVARVKDDFPEPGEVDEVKYFVNMKHEPELVDGVWTLSYELEEKSEHVRNIELTVHSRVQRKARDKKLIQSDEVVAGMESGAEKDAWEVYRQELRDVPSTKGFPFDIDWPVKPK
jgi:hypothetical protein